MSAEHDVMWFMTKVDDPAFACFNGEPHWDVWRWHGNVMRERDVPGLLNAVVSFSECNVACILADEATVRRIVDLHNAAISAPNGAA